MKLLVFIILGFITLNSYAAVYKCTGPSGKVEFQDKPCKANTVEKTLEIKSKKTDSGHSLWIEPNYVDSQYSVLFEGIEYEEYKHHNIPYGFKGVKVTGKVKEVFKGNFAIDDNLNVIVYFRSYSYDERISVLKNDFILSFCKSNSGIYFIGTAWQFQEPTYSNIKKFREVRDHGTEYKGDEGCIYNDHNLHPDKHK